MSDLVHKPEQAILRNQPDEVSGGVLLAQVAILVATLIVVAVVLSFRHGHI